MGSQGEVGCTPAPSLAMQAQCMARTFNRNLTTAPCGHWHCHQGSLAQ